MNNLLILLILFQLKHFLADYPLQTQYILGKFKEDWGFVLPLLAHVSVHGLFTWWIIFVIFKFSFKLAIFCTLLDMIVHFIMDRIKASPKMLGRFHPLTKYEASVIFLENPPSPMALKRIRDNKYFWWSLGLDQMVHHLTHYVIIFLCLFN
jgi:hypothetical protein